MGIFKGDGGRFYPSDQLTNAQAVAVLMRIIDGPQPESKADWSANYYQRAAELDVLSDVNMTNKNGLASRGNTVKVIYNAKEVEPSQSASSTTTKPNITPTRSTTTVQQPITNTQKYGTEQQMAYAYAYALGLTTKYPIENVDFYEKISQKELLIIMTTWTNKISNHNYELDIYDEYVASSALATKEDLKRILARALWGDTMELSDYDNALKKAEIITDMSNLQTNITRGEVFTLLQRTEQNYLRKNDPTTCKDPLVILACALNMAKCPNECTDSTKPQNYSRTSGNWGSCSQTCGGGTQTRTVQCKRSDGQVMSDSYCSGAKPSVSQSCNTQSCNSQTCTFGYNAQRYITVDTITKDTIRLQSPIITYCNGDAIYLYKLTYYSSTTKAKSKEIQLLYDIYYSNSINLNLGTSDDINPNETYYVIVTPIDVYDGIGTSSEMVCFNLSQKRYDIGSDCKSFQQPSTPIDLSSANITHTINGNVITFRWTAVDGIDSMDIFVFYLNQDLRVRVGEVQMSAEKYDYTMTWNGGHIFTFKPLNGVNELKYSLNAMEKNANTSRYPGCDTDDIKVGNYTIAACNVGANKAGISSVAYGHYYTYDEAQTVCANGYHTPTATEWKNLINQVSTTTTPEVNRSNLMNMLQLPAGGDYIGGGIMNPDTGYYWSSSAIDTTIAYQLVFDKDGGIYPVGPKLRDSGMFVRCFKN